MDARLAPVLTMGLALFMPALAYAEAPVSLGTSGAVSRAAIVQDASRNATVASFGAPTHDDRRMFSLRWRMPVVMLQSQGIDSPFAGHFVSQGAPLPGGIALAAEPMQNLSAFIPQLRLWETKKLVHVQAGVISTDIGHGSIVSGFANAPEGSIRRAGFVLEGNLAGIGAQVMMGDLFAPHSVLAGRVYGRPVMWFMAPDAAFLQPNELDLDPRTEIAGIWVTGLSAAVDAAAPLEVDNLTRTGAVFVGGWDNEAALLDNQLIKLVGSLDLNVMAGQQTGEGVGAGVHPGLMAQLDVLGARLELGGQYHMGTDAYVPRYFDRAYYLERNNVFGANATKAAIDAPASQGYLLRAKVGLLESLTLFGEAADQFAFDSTRGANSGRVTVGASGFLLFFGGNVAITKAGIQDYRKPDLLGPGFIMTAEGRVALLLNVFHVVGRYWRLHDEVKRNGDFIAFVDEGVMLGLEVNFDIL
jgi:hypothetical protein